MNIPTKPEKCQYIGCHKQPTNKVLLSLAVHANHEPAISSPLLWLCDEHASEIDWQKAGVDNNWETICSWFTSIGRLEPKKEFSKLIIQPIDESNNNSTIS